MKTDIVVLGHNWFAMSLKCIYSILNTANPIDDIKIIYVDNGSKFAVPAGIKNLCRVIELKENVGFAKGMNVGIKISRPDADVVIINNDCHVTPGWLEEIRKTADDSSVGIVSPMTERCCISVMCTGQKREDFDLAWFPAVCWFIKRSTIEKVGIFDPAYEMGWLEDNDYCKRVYQAGLKCRVSGKAFVHHAGSVTSNSVDFAGARERNKAYFNKKWGIK